MDIHKHNNKYVDSTRIIYTPSEFARENLMYLQEIGELRAKSSHSASHHNLTSYLFIMVTQGSGYLYYINERYEMKAGECAIINCQNEYYHESSSDDLWTLKWIHLNGPTAQGIYQKFVDRGGAIVLRPESLDAYNRIWQTISNLAASTDYIKDMRINQELSTLWSCIMEQSINAEAKSDNLGRKNLAEVRDYLSTNFREKITLDSLANTFYINKYYLSRLFKAEYGQTINDYLQNVRITHAKQMLRFSNLSIDQIGEESGISPLYYFSRVFKQSEGINPSDYRKMWR